MIWQLVKREPAWREIFSYIGVVAAVSTYLPAYAGYVFIFVVGLSWIRSLPAERASLFQAGLPIAAADLFLARMLAFLALVWLPAMAGAAALLLRNEGDAGGMLVAGAGLSVLVLAPLSHRVRELAGSHWAPAIAMTVISAVAWPATHYIPRTFLALLCAALCVVLFATIWRRLPMSFEVVEAKSADAPLRLLHAEPAAQPRAKRGSPLLHWLPIARSAFPPMTFLFLPIIVMQSVGGQWTYASSQVLFPMLMALPRLAWVRGLPVSRGILLSLLIAPWFLVLAANLAFGGLFLPSRTPIHYDYMADKLGAIRPPLEYWRVAPRGKAPVIESPWHETWQPPVQSLAGVAVYNPYGMGAANSLLFLEWQYGRATLAIYGQELAFNDYHPPTFRPLEQQTRFVAASIAACLCWLLLLLSGVFLSMHWRVGIRFPRACNLAGILLIVPMMLPLTLDVLLKLPSGSNGTALTNAALLQVLAILPAGVVPVVIAALLPLGILWWSARRLFDGIEPQPIDTTVRT